MQIDTGLDDIQSYNKWRNTLYGVYGSAALFISFPIVLTFGNVVMKKLNEKVGEKVERNSVTRPSSVLRTQTLTNQSIRTKVSVGRKSVAKKGAANSKMRALAYLIQSTAYWLYMLLGIMMYCYLIIYTYFSNNSSVLLVAKILCDFYFWSNSSYVLKYFFTRVWNMDDANTVEASRNSDQSHNADKK
ncbi:hypothetical protein HK103_005330 [Boothiomyces macroporosus]|uniref:Uncharacterized protein n=1 Tax=Boothiomyces macroporosus TaxID=261099 RepID=A0AAD5UQB9_9FUNG|nr:hypothetical protein HK103_005330 [Boothiomyces macroporosus]